MLTLMWACFVVALLDELAPIDSEFRSVSCDNQRLQFYPCLVISSCLSVAIEIVLLPLPRCWGECSRKQPTKTMTSLRKHLTKIWQKWCLCYFMPCYYMLHEAWCCCCMFAVVCGMWRMCGAHDWRCVLYNMLCRASCMIPDWWRMVDYVCGIMCGCMVIVCCVVHGLMTLWYMLYLWFMVYAVCCIMDGAWQWMRDFRCTAVWCVCNSRSIVWCLCMYSKWWCMLYVWCMVYGIWRIFYSVWW